MELAARQAAAQVAAAARAPPTGIAHGSSSSSSGAELGLVARRVAAQAAAAAAAANASAGVAPDRSSSSSAEPGLAARSAAAHAAVAAASAASAGASTPSTPGSTRRPQTTSHARAYRAGTSRPLRPYLGPQPQKRARLLDPESVKAAARFECSCGRGCMGEVSPNQIERARRSYLDLGGEGSQLEWLIGLVFCTVEEEGSVPRFVLGSASKNVLVCRAALLNCLGVSSDKLRHAEQHAAAGVRVAQQVQQERDDPKSRHAATWIERFLLVFALLLSRDAVCVCVAAARRCLWA